MAIKVISNSTLTVPKVRPVFLASTRTSPSPGTSNTWGANSMLRPTPRIRQPASRQRNRIQIASGENQNNAAMLKSMNRLNRKVTANCKNCIGGKFLRSRRT